MARFSVTLTLLVGLTCLATCIKTDGLTVEKQLELLNENYERDFKNLNSFSSDLILHKFTH
jgi:hypothetical protein